MLTNAYPHGFDFVNRQKSGFPLFIDSLIPHNTNLTLFWSVGLFCGGYLDGLQNSWVETIISAHLLIYNLPAVHEIIYLSISYEHSKLLVTNRKTNFSQNISDQWIWHLHTWDYILKNMNKKMVTNKIRNVFRYSRCSSFIINFEPTKGRPIL